MKVISLFVCEDHFNLLDKEKGMLALSERQYSLTVRISEIGKELEMSWCKVMGVIIKGAFVFVL